MTPIEVLTDETVDVGLIQSFIEKLPEKALQFGVRVLLALLVFAIGAQLIKLVCRILKKIGFPAEKDLHFRFLCGTLIIAFVR